MSLKSAEKLLPDFEDLDALARASSKARFNANKTKDKLEEYVAKCVRECYTEQRYWPAGKSPTQSYIEKVVKIVGNTEEDAMIIKELTEEYQKLRAEYEESRQLLDNLKSRISVFQTLSANQRNGM